MRQITRRHLGAISLAVATALAVPAMADETPPRIVVAGGDLTEIVFALGAGDRVVGVDQTSNFPAAALEIEQIGYVRRISPEGVLSLSPDLLLAAHDAGPDVAMEQLAAAGVTIAKAPETPRAGDIADKIRFVGDAIGKSAEAEALAAQFAENLTTVQEKVAQLNEAPRVLFVLSIQGGSPLIGGAGTSADEMIALAGGVNAGAEIEGYKPMSREAILATRPDVVLMMSQHAERVGGPDKILSRPEIALTPAGQNGRAITMEGMLLLGFGPRTPDAVAELARALHPETAEAAGL
ncbi:MAG: ABC transporter substrate-binding protein [Pseudomonadota bacterium]